MTLVNARFRLVRLRLLELGELGGNQFVEPAARVKADDATQLATAVEDEQSLLGDDDDF